MVDLQEAHLTLDPRAVADSTTSAVTQLVVMTVSLTLQEAQAPQPEVNHRATQHLHQHQLPTHQPQWLTHQLQLPMPHSP